LNRPDAVHEEILHPLSQVQSLVAGNRCSEDSENHQTAYNPFWISKDASWELYIRVNSANEFWRQFHRRYFQMATYWQFESCILIYQQSHLNSTDAQAQ
jgi:hypothetical protein